MNKRVWFCRIIVFIFGPAFVVIASLYTIERQTVFGESQHVFTGSKTGSKTRDRLSRIREHRGNFAYDSEALMKSIIEIRKSNCMMKKNNARVCDLLTNCKNSTQNYTLTSNSCQKRLPGALIIGAFKAGTRELIDFLAMNPMIHIKKSPKYETSYFDRNLGYGLEWYREHMPWSLDSQVTVEKSPGYWSSLVAPKEIHNMNPDIKLILLVREPVSRAISHLSFTRQNSAPVPVKNLNGFIGTCILQKQWLDFSRPDKKINKNCFVIKDSSYYDNLKRYLQYFRQDQFHIIDSEEFVRDPCSVLHRVEKFLGVESFIQCTDLIYDHAKGFFCVSDFSGEKTGICYDHTRGRVNDSDTEDERQLLEPILRRFFKPLNKQFFELTHRKFSW